MFKFVARRVIQSLFSLVGLFLLVFFLARMTGDPSALYLPIDASAETKAAFAARNGFDDPSYVQFARFVAGALRFDFGDSMLQSRPALTVVLQAFPITLMLAALTMSFAVSLAILIGSLAARRPGGVFDRTVNLIALLGASAPNFWIAIVGILAFAVWLRILPTSGMGGPSYWVLPVAVLMLRPLGLIAQVVRGSMISALSSGYVKTARAKGIRNRKIVFVHALRNAMLPVITVAGDQAAGIVNGAVIIETIFGFPGVGKLLIDSITYRDYAVLQAAVLVTAVAILIMNIAIDMIYGLLDPRIRFT